MYVYNEAENFESHVGGGINQTVPNVLVEDAYASGVHTQSGAQLTGVIMNDAGAGMAHQQQTTVPTYVVDTNITQFEIPDPLLRRALVRNVLYVLLIVNIISMLTIELFIFLIDEPLSMATLESIAGFGFCMFITMYYFSDERRYAPRNMIALIIVIMIHAALDCVSASQIGGQMSLISPIVISLQTLGVILYTKQTRFKFNNINAILLVLLLFFLSYALIAVLFPKAIDTITFTSTLGVIYVVYDLQLQLSGHHRYNLQPGEHLFAAVNIYADIPNLFWRFFRYTVLDQFIKIYEFFTKCCQSEVC